MSDICTQILTVIFQTAGREKQFYFNASNRNTIFITYSKIILPVIVVCFLFLAGEMSIFSGCSDCESVLCVGGVKSSSGLRYRWTLSTSVSKEYCFEDRLQVGVTMLQMYRLLLFSGTWRRKNNNNNRIKSAASERQQLIHQFII